MRIMMMHKHDAKTEAGERPPPELLARMGEYVGEHAKRGTLLSGDGLGRSSTRTRLSFQGGACTVKHGPYQGGRELPAAALLFKVKDRDEGIAWAKRYGAILSDGEIELGALTEGWDLGFMPKPENAPLRLLLLEKASEASENSGHRAETLNALSALHSEMREAGILISAERLLPSSQGKRLLFRNNELRVIDGPFAESKELIGGFAVMQLPSLEVAIEESIRYAEILGGTVEIDLRPLED